MSGKLIFACWIGKPTLHCSYQGDYPPDKARVVSFNQSFPQALNARCDEGRSPPTRGFLSSGCIHRSASQFCKHSRQSTDLKMNPFKNRRLQREIQEQRDLLLAEQRRGEETQRDLLLAKQRQEEETQRWKEQQFQDQQRQLQDQQRQLQEQQWWKEQQFRDQQWQKEQQFQNQQQQLHDQLMRAERQLEQERQAQEQERQKIARQREAERLSREQLEKERKRRLERLKLTSPEALRGLRDLIRARYALDMEIWSLKGARKSNRPIVEEKMGRADAILMEIYSMVETWEENDKVWTTQEWELARDVRKRILEKGKRQWKDNPPWNEN
jgi:hypothetical protein